jgi:hypothetical protein
MLPVNRAEQPGEHLLALAVAFLLRERLQRLDQVEARLEQRHELHREERGRKAPSPRGERQVQAARLERDQAQALPAHLLGGERCIRCLQLERDHLLPRVHGEDVESHLTALALRRAWWRRRHQRLSGCTAERGEHLRAQARIAQREKPAADGILSVVHVALPVIFSTNARASTHDPCQGRN